MPRHDHRFPLLGAGGEPTDVELNLRLLVAPGG